MLFNRIVLILALALAAAGMRAQTDAEQVTAIGRNVLSMDDYMLAIHYFNQAIKAKPYLAEPYYLRALAKLQLEDYEGAEADCTLAIERNKFVPEAYRLRGFARQSMGRDSLAVADYDIGLEYNPQDRYFLFYKGVALTELGRHTEADSVLSRLMRLYPRMDEGMTALARLNVLRGDTTTALADISRAIDITGGTTLQPYLLRADIGVKRRDWQSAAADMDQAIRLRPEETDYYINRAFVRYNADDWFGAMADYNYALELDPTNRAARFNRALLRMEAGDYDRAAADFGSVLDQEPSNFHARYNLGLANLERGHYREALRDFDAISKRYPRFHPVYYAKAEAFRLMGNMRAAMQQVRTADDIVRAYVHNPEKNPLDRPAIQMAAANDGRRGDDESEEEVMARFNQLVTASGTADTQLAYNERIKGRVQDRQLQAEPEPDFALTFDAPPATLQGGAQFSRALDDFNSANYIGRKIWMAPASDTVSSADTDASPTQGAPHMDYDALFALAEALEQQAAASTRAADWLALGVARAMLKDFAAARAAAIRALELYPDFALAYFLRGYASAHDADARMHPLADGDYDAALSLAPDMAAPWHNKGDLHYRAGDYTAALEAYNRALAADPALGASAYNRGLTYLRLGNLAAALADLRRAGELGIAPAYPLLKRMRPT